MTTGYGNAPFGYAVDLTTPASQNFLKANGVKPGDVPYDKITTCASSHRGSFTLYRLEGDCRQKKKEKWIYEANFSRNGLYKGEFESYCNGSGSAWEKEIPAFANRDLNKYSIRWRSWSRSSWSSNGPVRDSFSLVCNERE